ncbi:MAG: glycosyltransferase, partial [Candidatus Rokubacteria bacterium]|nr:glycosyltransferase [Candidatus Rokubacteria bacterium]
MRYGLVGWATASGLGSLNVDLARNARGLARWLIPDDAAVAPHPAYVDAVPVETMFCRAAGDEPAYARFLDGLDAVVFFEVPYLQDFDLVGECRRRGIVTCCIPNWEWFPETGWSEGVDMLWCPTAYTADVARAMAARRPYRWAARIFGSRWGIDTARFPFRERGPVRRFVFANGSGGYAMRKGADALHAVARLVPEASFLFYTQNGNHPTPMPPNVEVRQDRLSQRADLYAEGDVFLSLSRWEGIGLPAYEAQACGLPVACADAPPMAECGADFLLPATAPTTVRILDRDVPRWEIDTVYLARLLRDLAGADVSARSRAASARVRARHDVTGVLEEFEASLARVCA